MQFLGNIELGGSRVSFQSMWKCLEGAGYKVHVNDYAVANANPDYPVGLVGLKGLVEDWSLSNPAVLGPSLWDHPNQVPDLMTDRRFKAYLTLGGWWHSEVASVFGDQAKQWFAGIDPVLWPDLSNQPKITDFLLYDKLLWDREDREADLIAPIQAALEARGLSLRDSTLQKSMINQPTADCWPSRGPCCS